jgi:putative transposase
MAAWRATQGDRVNRQRGRRLMRRLGLAALDPRPNTSKPAPAPKIYPYRLGGLASERVNQVWGPDVTYIPMAKGFLYLVVIMDWVSRAVLAWRRSNTRRLGTGSRTTERYGIACRDPSGQWRIVN